MNNIPPQLIFDISQLILHWLDGNNPRRLVSQAVHELAERDWLAMSNFIDAVLETSTWHPSILSAIEVADVVRIARNMARAEIERIAGVSATLPTDDFPRSPQWKLRSYQLKPNAWPPQMVPCSN